MLFLKHNPSNACPYVTNQLPAKPQDTNFCSQQERTKTRNWNEKKQWSIIYDKWILEMNEEILRL